jgi:tRNA(fMet)-specific endonuclease VapC
VTHILDTDHLSILGQQNSREWPTLVAHIHAAGQANVSVSIVSFHEQFRGCHAKLIQTRKPDELIHWYQLLFEILEVFKSMNVVRFDSTAAGELVRIRAACPRVGDMDLRIAATALASKLTLVTRNVRDFGKVPGLRIEDWTK